MHEIMNKITSDATWTPSERLGSLQRLSLIPTLYLEIISATYVQCII